MKDTYHSYLFGKCDATAISFDEHKEWKGDNSKPGSAKSSQSHL